MPRIRTIKPDMPTDETLGHCSRDARLLFAYGLTVADDYGRLRASGAYLRGALFPYDDDIGAGDVARWAQELIDAGPWVAYEARNENYVAYRTWWKNQRIDNRGRPSCPEPPPELGLPGPDSRLRAVDGAVENSSKVHSRRTAANRGDSPLEGEGEQEGEREREGEREGEGPSAGSQVNGRKVAPSRSFEVLWAAWPEAKRTHKPEALEEWRRALTAGADPTETVERALAWCAYWTRERFEPRYIPRPGRWLRDSRDAGAPTTNGADARRAASIRELQAFLGREL